MVELMAMKAVYCYMFPETWNVLEEVKKASHRKMYMRTTPAQEVTELFRNVFNPVFEFPAKTEGPLKGNIDLDKLFIPVGERIIEKYSKVIIGLNDFDRFHPSPGSSEALLKTLVLKKMQGVDILNILKGEYEGYGITGGNALEMQVCEHDLQTLNPRKIQPGLWYLSNPSAIDGNVLPDGVIDNLLDAGHELCIDFAYVGSTKPYMFNAEHENIAAVFLSPSKPYGVFENRLTGYVILREKHFPKKQSDNLLYGNEWFTDKIRTLQSMKLLQEFGPNDNGTNPFYDIYSPLQREIINDLNIEFDLTLRPSHSFLLAHMNDKDLAGLADDKKQLIKPFERGSGYRFCLTPYFELKEAKQ